MTAWDEYLSQVRVSSGDIVDGNGLPVVLDLDHLPPGYRPGTYRCLPCGRDPYDRRRDQLGALADGLVRDLAQTLGTDEGHARAAAVAVLMRMRADEAAYERVAEQRGLLPL